MNKTTLASCIAVAFLLPDAAIANAGTDPASSDAAATTTQPPVNSRNLETLAAQDNHATLDTVSVTAKLDRARHQLSPRLGASDFLFDQDAINQLPLGSATSLNQVLLRAPGVANDSYGQVHVRGDHANLQYRINGVIVPESISGFGQALDTRVIDSLSLLTGALPAQFGYRTAGVVDITTKSGSAGNDGDGVGGSVGVSAGSFGTLNPSADIYGSSGPWSFFFTANYLQSNLGIENPTSSRNAIHDDTNQLKSFGYLSYVLSDTARLSFLFGASNNRFQIPNNPDQEPAFTLAGIEDFNSRNLNGRQNEQTRFGVLSMQGLLGQTNYQVSAGQRYTSVHYQPDPIGDLVFNGVAGTIDRGNRANTLQADLAMPLNDSHTLRYGLHLSQEHPLSNNVSQVFPADAEGNQSSDVPITIVDNAAKINAKTYGLYVQDEWKINDKLTLNAGVRGDKVAAYVHEGQLSPRLGLVYQATDRTTLHAGYARYFTPPPTELIAESDIALFQGTTNALPTDVNAQTLSERSHYFDAGISQKIGSDLTVGLDVYYRKVHNLLDEGQFGSALVFSPFNYNKGKVKGAELTVNYERGPLSAFFNLSSSRADGKQVVTGQYNFEQDQLDYIAAQFVHLDHDQRLTSSGGISYDLDGWKVGSDFLYGSGLRTGFANSAHLPQYYSINLSIAHTFATLHGIDIRVAAINVTDRSYQLRDGSGIGVGAPQFGARRGVYVGVEKSF